MMAKCSTRMRVLISFFVLFQASTSPMSAVLEFSSFFDVKKTITGIGLGVVGTWLLVRVGLYKFWYAKEMQEMQEVQEMKKKLKIADTFIEMAKDAQLETQDIATVAKDGLLANRRMAEQWGNITNDDQRGTIFGVIKRLFCQKDPEKYKQDENANEELVNLHGFLFFKQGKKQGKPESMELVPAGFFQYSLFKKGFQANLFQSSQVTKDALEKMFFAKEVKKEI
jgi:predicted small secreted protein